jgi:hypothetical protein
MRRVVLLIVATLALATPARADFENRTSILLKCLDKTFEVYCLGYIGAIYDAMEHGAVIFGVRACPKGKITLGQLKNIVVPWVHKNMPPGSREGVEGIQFPGAAVVAAAIARAFPCR